MIKLIYIAILAISIMSCRGNPYQKVEAEVVSVWQPKDLLTGNLASTTGLYDHSLYYMEKKGKDFSLAFCDFQGNIIKRIGFTQGKGPGEFINPTYGVKIADDKIYIYDAYLKKVLVYDINGKHIDDYLLDNRLDRTGTFEVMGDFLYFHGTEKVKFAKLNLAAGVIEMQVNYESDKQKPGDPVNTGYLTKDPEGRKFYYAYNSIPYRIEIFDENCKEVNIITRKLPEKYFKFALNDNTSFEGHEIMTSMKFNKNHIFVPFGGGYIIRSDNTQQIPVVGIPRNFYISVFSKDGGKLIYEITSQEIKQLNGLAYIVAVTDQDLVLAIRDFKDTLTNILGNDYVGSGMTLTRDYFVILKNPI